MFSSSTSDWISSNTAYAAIGMAQAEVQKNPNEPIPLQLRNAPTKLMKELNYGADYKYAHNHENNFVDINYLPEYLDGTVFYEPGNNKTELSFKERLVRFWSKRYRYKK